MGIKFAIAIAIILITVLPVFSTYDTFVLFEDGFEDGVRFTNWDYFSTGWQNSNTACGSGGGCNTGTYCACSENGGDSYMEMFNPLVISNRTLAQTYDECFLNFSYWVDSSLDSGEYFWLYYYYDGGYDVGLEIRNGGGDDSTWHDFSWNMTPYLSDDEFDFGFEAYYNDNGEEIVIDDVVWYCLNATVSTDSCTYSSGDWVIDATDDCVLSDDTDLSSNNIYCEGSGTLTISAIINVDMALFQSGCKVYFDGGWIA